MKSGNYRLPSQVEISCTRLVLHVQEGWGNHWSSDISIAWWLESFGPWFFWEAFSKVGNVNSAGVVTLIFGAWLPIAKWGLCPERNVWTFGGYERSCHNLKILFLKTLFEWINSSGMFSFIAFHDLLDWCTFSV